MESKRERERERDRKREEQLVREETPHDVCGSRLRGVAWAYARATFPRSRDRLRGKGKVV